MDGELDDLPEQAFYMVGAIEDVFEQAKGSRPEPRPCRYPRRSGSRS